MYQQTLELMMAMDQNSVHKWKNLGIQLGKLHKWHFDGHNERSGDPIRHQDFGYVSL